MITQIGNTFDPSTATQSDIINTLPGGIGTWIVSNDSATTVQLAWGGNKKTIPAGVVDVIVFTQTTQRVAWTRGYMLSNASNSPISVLSITGYTSDEKVTGTYPFTLPRLANIGNLTTPYTPTYYTGAGGNTYQLNALAVPTTIYDDYDVIAGSVFAANNGFYPNTTLSSGQSVTITNASSTVSVNNGKIFGLTSMIAAATAAPSIFTSGSGSYTETWLVSGLSFTKYDLLLQISDFIVTTAATGGGGTPSNSYTLTAGTDVLTVTFNYAGSSFGANIKGILTPISVTLSNSGMSVTLTNLDFTQPLLLRWTRSNTSYYTAGVLNDVYPLTASALPDKALVYYGSGSTATSLQIQRSIGVAVSNPSVTFAPVHLMPLGYVVPPNAFGLFVYRPWIQAGLA